MQFDHLIHRNIPGDLSTVPFHENSPYVSRYAPEHFPVHVAVHRISNAQGHPDRYVELHSHDDPEINILISDSGCLEYSIELEDEEYRVESPATIWIPAGVRHAANVVRGSGQFVCMILADSKRAFPMLREKHRSEAER